MLSSQLDPRSMETLSRSRSRKQSHLPRAVAVWMSGLLLTLGGLGLTAADKDAGPAPVKAVELAPSATIESFPDRVQCVTVSPDGKRVAAGSYEMLMLIDAASKMQQQVLKEPAGFVRSVAFSPDSQQLVTGSYQSARVWNAATGEIIRSLKGHRGYVNSVAFSPDGKTLATASDDETIKLWSAADGAELATLRGHSLPVTSIAFSPDGAVLASSSGDATKPSKAGEVKLWILAKKEAAETLAAHDRAITSVAFSEDGKELVTASYDELIKVWNLADLKEPRTLEGHSRPVNQVVRVPGKAWLASAAGGRFVGKTDGRVWNAKTGDHLATLVGHEGPVNAIAAAPAGDWLVTASNDKSVRFWSIANLPAAQPTETVKAADSAPVALASNQTAEPVKAAEAKLAAAQDAAPAAADDNPPKSLRAGIIGLDTSHAIAFTQLLNAKEVPAELAGCRIVAAYPKGSPDIESSTSRVPGYTKQVQDLGVEIVESIDELLTKVDVVFLETNDGRPHLEQVLPVLKARKPVFIDKPIAASLSDAIAIFAAAEKYEVPVFSSSSLRYTIGAQALRNGKIGDILGCDAYSPCSLEKTHPDLFWYGIHGVETLFTVMGTGCESVSRVSTPGIDVAVGTWKNGRVGTFRGIRQGSSGYGGTAFGTKGIEQIGSYSGYRPMLVEIVKFFQTGKAPVAPEETLEIYAFMEAADESKRQGGQPVSLESVMTKARAAVQQKQD